MRLQDYDTQLQRALNYEDYDLANDIRQRRQSVDEAMDKLRVRLPLSSCILYSMFLPVFVCSPVHWGSERNLISARRFSRAATRKMALECL